MREEMEIIYRKIKTTKNNQMEIPGLENILFKIKIHCMDLIEDWRQSKKGSVNLKADKYRLSKLMHKEGKLLGGRGRDKTKNSSASVTTQSSQP